MENQVIDGTAALKRFVSAQSLRFPYTLEQMYANIQYRVIILLDNQLTTAILAILQGESLVQIRQQKRWVNQSIPTVGLQLQLRLFLFLPQERKVVQQPHVAHLRKLRQLRPRQRGQVVNVVEFGVLALFRLRVNSYSPFLRLISELLTDQTQVFPRTRRLPLDEADAPLEILLSSCQFKLDTLLELADDHKKGRVKVNAGIKTFLPSTVGMHAYDGEFVVYEGEDGTAAEAVTGRHGMVDDLLALRAPITIGLKESEMSLEGLAIDEDILQIGLHLVGLAGIPHDHQLLLTLYLSPPQVANRKPVAQLLISLFLFPPSLQDLIRECKQRDLLFPGLILEIEPFSINWASTFCEEVLKVGIWKVFDLDGLPVGLEVLVPHESFLYIDQQLDLVCESTSEGRVDVMGAGQGDIVREHDGSAKSKSNQPIFSSVPIGPQQSDVVIDVFADAGGEVWRRKGENFLNCGGLCFLFVLLWGYSDYRVLTVMRIILLSEQRS